MVPTPSRGPVDTTQRVQVSSENDAIRSRIGGPGAARRAALLVAVSDALGDPEAVYDNSRAE